jgi:hypothetical protein
MENITGNYPFNATLFKPGHFNLTHTSNISIVYTPQTLPTPWPFLVLSFLISFLTALWGFASNKWHLSPSSLIGKSSSVEKSNHDYERGQELARQEYSFPTAPLPYSTEHTKQQKWSTFELVFNLFLLALATLRSVAATVGAIKAFVNNTARWAPPSALAMLLISTWPYALNHQFPHMVFRILAALDTFIVLGSLALTTAGIFFRRDVPYYGKYSLAGGNCPFTLSSCPPAGFPITGCYADPGGVWSLQSLDINSGTDPNGNLDINLVAQGERIIGALIFAPFIIAFPFGIWLAKICWGGVNRKRKLKPEIRDDPWRYNRYRLAKYFAFALVLIVGIAVSSLWLHIHAMKRTSPVIVVVDGFGPRSVTGGEGPFGGGKGDDSWTDCFNVTVPQSSNGFWHEWTDAQRSEVEMALAII